MSRRHLSWALLLLVFASTRLYNLLGLPVFLDEALHIVWSGRVFEPGRLERHVNDGKLLQVYLFALILPWSSDAPWLARASSALTGLVGLGCAHAIGQRLYGIRVAWLSALLYLLCPYALFYDRMALADIYVSSFSGLSLLACLRLAERASLRRAFAVALALTFAAVAKMTGVLAAATPVATLLLLGARSALRWLPLAYGCYAAVVGIPLFYFAKRARVYGHLADALVEREVGAWSLTGQLGDRLAAEASWLADYWTWPLLLAACAGLALGLARRDRRAALLGALAAWPALAFALVSGHIFPRYLVASIIPTTVLAAAFADALLTRLGPRLAVPALVALAIPAARFDALLLLDPQQAPLPAVDRGQYLQGWQSGYGAAEAARYLRAQLRGSPSGLRVVLHRHSERTVHLILRAYLMNLRGLEIVEADLRDDEELARLRAESRARPTLVALATPWETERDRFPDTARIFSAEEHVLEFRRPEGELTLTIYRLSRP